MKYFISHSYKDREWAEELVSILKNTDSEITSDGDIFFSSTPETGSDIKQDLLPNIDVNMNNSKIIILVVTENYLRSHYCYYELNIASYLKRLGKSVILIVQHEDIYERIRHIFPDPVYISAEHSSAGSTLLRWIGSGKPDESVFAQVELFFKAMLSSSVPLGTAFLGMSQAEYENAFSFVEEHHLEKMTFGYPSSLEIMTERLPGAKEIIFVSTTGSGFLKTYRRGLTEAVVNKADISIVIADANSQFCRDVGEIEVFDVSEQAGLAEENCKRISTEFNSTVQYLNEIYKDAKKQTASDMGSIGCFSGYTLIRQTAFIVRYEDDSVWGWITCTMPPERSADKTPSIVISGSLDSDTFAQVVWKYCKTLTELATQRGGYFIIDGSSAPKAFPVTKGSEKDVNLQSALDSAKEYWTNKYNLAKANMEARGEVYDSVLIEVAAQHPLFHKTEPGEEFRKRLDKAIELYREFTDQGISVSIYVPGSRHKYNGIADDISLSLAGCNYLKSKGIPEHVLLGDEINIKYKGDDGVYNSADECYAASKVFDDGEYAKLICVCSPNQIARKTMLYMEFGCLPVCYGVTTKKMYHSNMVNEIFNSLNVVLYFDHSWQDKSSSLYSFFRDERKP